MKKTVLQIPISQELKITAEKEATSQGFSSLQELIRVFLSNVASHKIEIAIREPISLSPLNAERYEEMTEDFESGKDIKTVGNVDDLISKLHEDSVS